MRILFLNIDRRQTCSFYRSGGVSRDLSNKLGALIDVLSFGELQTDWQMIANYDVVMIQRPYSSSSLAFCRHVKKLHIPLWLDYDDNLFCVPPENKAWPIFNDPNIQKDITEIIRLADVVSVTNEELKASTIPLNSNVVVIPNAFNDGIFDVNRILPKRNKTVLWRGSETHVYDLMLYTKEISRCAEEFPDYEFNFVGFNPWMIPPKENIKFTKPLDVIDFFHDMYELAPSVVQVPLQDSFFNRCKSNIAFIEGSYWGATCVVPDWWGDLPGTASYNKENYYDALKTAIIDNADWNKLSWQYIKDNLLLSNINRLRVELIKNL